MPPANIPITVVVNLDDDLINPQEVIKRFQSTATIRAFETGGHRFKDKTPIIREVAAAL